MLRKTEPRPDAVHGPRPECPDHDVPAPSIRCHASEPIGRRHPPRPGAVRQIRHDPRPARHGGAVLGHGARRLPDARQCAQRAQPGLARHDHRGRTDRHGDRRRARPQRRISGELRRRPGGRPHRRHRPAGAARHRGGHRHRRAARLHQRLDRHQGRRQFGDRHARHGNDRRGLELRLFDRRADRLRGAGQFRRHFARPLRRPAAQRADHGRADLRLVAPRRAHLLRPEPSGGRRQQDRRAAQRHRGRPHQDHRLHDRRRLRRPDRHPACLGARQRHHERGRQLSPDSLRGRVPRLGHAARRRVPHPRDLIRVC